MARQYQIPGGPFVNVTGSARQYQLPGYGYLNSEAFATSNTVPQGNVSLSTFAPSVLIETFRAPLAADLVLSTAAPSVALSADFTVAVPQGALRLQEGRLAGGAGSAGTAYALRGGDLTGSDSAIRQMIGSFWFNLGTSATGIDNIFRSPNTPFTGISIFWRASDSSFNITVDGVTSNNVVDINFPDSFLEPKGQWNHIAFAFDTGPGMDETNQQVYINGSKLSNDYIGAFDEDLNFTASDWGILRNPSNTSTVWNGYVEDFWLSINTIIDLDSNLGVFYDDGWVFLGENGELPTGSSPILFFSGASGSWHINKGTGGGFTLNGTLSSPPEPPQTAHVPFIPENTTVELAHGSLQIEGGYEAQGVSFDGANDYLVRGGGLTGAADGKIVSGSFWIKTTNGGIGQIIHALSGGLNVFLASNAIQIFAFDVGGSTTLFHVNSSAINSGEWRHVAFSFDTSDTSKRHLYVDGASDLSVSSYTDGNIDLTQTDWAIGGRNIGLQKLLADIADLWIDFGSYIDLSDPENLAKFYRNGLPVDLGSDGSNPTGAAPIIFLSGPVDSWHTNEGEGGGFTAVGALTAAATNPQDTHVPSVRQGTPVDPVQGSLSLVTAVPGSVRTDSHSLAPGQSNLALDSQAATADVTTSHERDVPAGDLAFSTAAPGAARTENVDTQLPAGDLALDGSAPAAGEQHIALAQGGNLALSVASPTLNEFVSIFVPEGSLVFSLGAPEPYVSANIAMLSGNLVLATTNPATGTGQFSNPEVGDLQLASEIPAVLLNEICVSGVADVVLSGAAPGLQQDTEVVGQAGGLALSTAAVSRILDATVSPDSADLVIDGQVIDLTFLFEEWVDLAAGGVGEVWSDLVASNTSEVWSDLVSGGTNETWEDLE